jgi:homoserine dehydrogenase
MVQEGRAKGDGGAVPVCILTHQSKEGAVRRAIASIEKQNILKSQARLIRIEDV